ncbi:accessory Sec system glycosyltransferase GtfA [Carnobacteriaceae bacterium zg-84]|uniref:accessory Sec system glycosyltransferase GtfA n=1 Tax=Granulicatella sp. zg-84 TaxID=2678503 RepID=UPI0013BF3DD0|nr:accessory Sec system glycosyltransferase GtfA [Granulicatella sp. zg-84]NEW66010.1 accessory Sec system glycosyltransferase GtfA [Granulicatella sp. zg-84]QMI85846.1 accessory Sec system glycosyltransferase GtfA [Carnobacteriaceae bacterium zg-84]
MIYNINLGIGWASSGVEYAQAYRATVLRKIKQPAKFVFTDMIQSENIEHLTKNIGIEDSEVIWLYQYFTNIKIAPTTYTIQDFLAQFEIKPSRVEEDGLSVRYFFDALDFFVTVYVTQHNKQLVNRAEFVSKGNLIRKDYYSYTRVFSEYYAPKDNRAYLYQRRFFNEDGTTAFDEIIEENHKSIFKFPDYICFSKEELISYFIQSLHLTSDDLVIIDRATGIAQSVLRHKGQAKVATVVHAEHYSPTMIDESYILWNNYYEYQFSNAGSIDLFITSTDTQTKTLTEQFEKYTSFSPKVVTIPVGSLKQLMYPKGERRPYALMTASRLAGEKHIDWLIKAVIHAKKYLPDLSFDIYGKGGEESKLKSMIEERGAQAYIRLMGHHHLTDVYADYQAYIAGSTSEGFGLTLMEAVGSGLPIIGFDVPYGNPTFVDNGVNGYLIKRHEEDNEDYIIEQFSKKIIELFTTGQLTAFQEASYRKASQFLDKEIEYKWQCVLEEVLHDKSV